MMNEFNRKFWPVLFEHSYTRALESCFANNETKRTYWKRLHDDSARFMSRKPWIIPPVKVALCPNYIHYSRTCVLPEWMKRQAL